MGLIYIEYISRLPGVDLDAFRNGAPANTEGGWAAGYGEDQLVLDVGRTWRLGPEPEYFAVWYTADANFERIDAWDRIMRSGEVDHLLKQFDQVARIDVAGCYEPLIEPVSTRNGTYYAEFFRANGDLESIRSFYTARARSHQHLSLNLLVYRIGRLGPDPGGLAVWVLPNFAALAEIAQELDGVDQPVELVTAATYADFGCEIL